jgi:GGDEF domain-containing protein
LEHNGEFIRYGFSYGIAASPVDGSDFDGLVESADRRMYAMKRRKSNSADP